MWWLKLNPCPGSVQIPLPALYSLTVIQFMPEAPLWGIPNNPGHKQNNSFQEFYPVWPRFCCQVSWLSYFSSLSLANTGPAIKGIAFIIILKYTHSFEIALPRSVKKRLKCTHKFIFSFFSLAELKVALVTQEKELVWGWGFYISPPTPIPCIYAFFNFSVNSFSSTLT